MHKIGLKEPICIQQFLPTIFVAARNIFHLIDVPVALKVTLCVTNQQLEIEVEGKILC